MRGGVTEFLYASGSQSHYPLTPVNPHFLQLWKSGKTTTINCAENKKHVGSRSFFPKAASVEWTGTNPAVDLCVSPAQPGPVGTG